MLKALAFSMALTNFYQVDVVKVQDGDTIQVALPNMPSVFSPIGVRIQGIDSPELHSKKPCERREAVRAKTALQSLVYSKKVDLLSCTRDKFFRLLCRISLEKQDIAEYMLSHALARAYFGEKKSAWACR